MTKPYVRQFVPENMRAPEAKILNALFTAFEENEEYLEAFFMGAQDNLFAATADFQHFVKILQAQGVFLPAGGGLNVSAFRQIAPLVANLPKQAIGVTSAILESFYGLSLTHPSVISSMPESYSLLAGDTLTVETADGTVTVTVDPTVFSNPASVSAGELAGYLSGIQRLFLCDAYVNRDDNLSYLRLLSRGTGQGDWIRVKGGTLQNVLRFPPLVPTANAFQTTFRLVKQAAYTDVIRVEWANPDSVRFEQVNIAGSVLNVGLHGLTTGTAVVPASDGTLPSPLMAGTTYYVVNATDNSFELSATLSGAAITFTTQGSADFHYVRRLVPTLAAADPQLYRLKPTDFVTFRNLFDVSASGLTDVFVRDEFGNQVIDIVSGDPVVAQFRYNSGNFSVLNGSWSIEKVGLDYFYIRVRGLNLEELPPSTGTVVQLGANDVTFTEDYQHRIYDQDEYVTQSETKTDTLTVTVPAVPPIVRRFLQGSMNIAGFDANVSGFTRTTLSLPLDAENIADGSAVLLSSDRVDADFRLSPYKVVTKVGTDYVIDDTDPEFAVLPFTASTPFGVSDPFSATLDNNLVRADFAYRHGYRVGDAITIAGALNNGGFSANGEWVVAETPSETSLVFRHHTGIYAGRVVPVGLSTITLRTVTGRSDGADLEFVFPTPAVLASAAIEVNKPLTLAITGSETVFFSPAWDALATSKFLVTEVIGTRVFARAGVAFPYAPTIASGVKVRAPRTRFGGGFARQFFNTFSTPIKTALLDGYNYDRFVSTLRVQVLGFPSGSVTNPLWQGPFLFDPEGASGIRYQAGQPNATLATPIVKGSNDTSIDLTNATEFPTTGYVALSFGGSEVEGPIRYVSISQGFVSSTMELDPAYTFTTSHSVGAAVRFVSSLSPHQPVNDGQDFASYLTSASPARNTLFQFLKQVLSVSIFLEQDLRLPEVLYEDAGLPIYD